MDSHQQRVYGQLNFPPLLGQFKDWSIPVAEPKRLLVSLTPSIQTRTTMITLQALIKEAEPNCVRYFAKEEVNMDMEAPPDNVHKLKHINKHFY